MKTAARCCQAAILFPDVFCGCSPLRGYWALVRIVALVVILVAGVVVSCVVSCIVSCVVAGLVLVLALVFLALLAAARVVRTVIIPCHFKFLLKSLIVTYCNLLIVCL